MPFISITRLRVRSWHFLPQFLWYSLRSSRQAQRSHGFLGGALLNDKHRTFWTMTVWESEAAMKAFRGAGGHREAMTKLAHWCDEASVAHWTDQQPRVPDAEEAYRGMREHGRPSRVNQPSQNHQSLTFDPPSRPQIPLKPMPSRRAAAAA